MAFAHTYRTITQMSTASDYFTLAADADTGITRLTLNRPERMNTMDAGFFPAIGDAVRALDEAGQTRVLVLASTGKHFSAGMALGVFGGGLSFLATSDARKRLAFQTGLRRLMDSFSALDEARFPVLCAVQGGCIGGALDMAAACDIRVCTADAFFSVQEIQIGMAADLGSLQRLPKLIPPGLARQLAYTGERLDSRRALDSGLVNAVLPDVAALDAHVMALAREMAAKSPLAMAGSKLALNHARDHGTSEALSQMALLQSAIFDLGDLERAVAAWKDKRLADFAPLTPKEQA